MSTIAAGMRVADFKILSVDPSGKRAIVACPCGGTHAFSVEALIDGTATCAAIPLTAAQSAHRRAEHDQRQRQRDLRAWRPGG